MPTFRRTLTRRRSRIWWAPSKAASGGAAVGSGTVTLPHLTAVGTSAAGSPVGSATITLPHLTAAGSSTALARGLGVLSLPHLTASGASGALARGSGVLSLPHLIASGTGLVPGVATSVFRGRVRAGGVFTGIVICNRGIDMPPTVPTGHLRIGSTNKLELIGFQDLRDLTYPTDATVVATLYDPTGAAVSGAQGLPLAYVSPSSGSGTTYRGLIPHTVSLAPGIYTALTTATKGSDVRVFQLNCPTSE